MKDEDFRVARILKSRLAEVTPLLDFKIFGSRARGTAETGSDMDVFIEVENLDELLKQKMRAVVLDVGFENSLYISPLIFTRQEIENSPLRISPLVKNIMAEGIAA
jgi:predicted nucleotidyltransferase